MSCRVRIVSWVIERYHIPLKTLWAQNKLNNITVHYLSNISHLFDSSVCRSKQFEPSHDKSNKMDVRPAKTQISLGIRLA